MFDANAAVTPGSASIRRTTSSTRARDRLWRLIPIACEKHPHRHQWRGVEAGVGVLDVQEASDEQRGADQQRQRQRHLDDDEGVAQAIAHAAAAGATAAVLERAGEIACCRLQCGREAEQNACQHGHGDREHHDARVHRPFNVVRNHHRRRDGGDQGFEAAIRDEQAERRAQQAEEHALRQQLAHQPRSTGAERRPDGHLPLPAGRPREQQVGDVGARNQEHQHHGAHHRGGRDLERQRHQFVAQRSGPCAPAIVVAIGACELAGDFGQLTAGRRDRCVRRQTATRGQRALATGGGVFERHHRDPELRDLRKLKTGRHHPNHGVGRAVDDQHAADDRLVGGVAALPEAVAQHHDRRRPGPIVVRCELPADHRMHTEQRKEVPRHRRSLEPLGFDAFGNRQASVGIGGEAGEAARLRLPVAEVLIRDPAAIAGARDLSGIQHREAFGLARTAAAAAIRCRRC